MKLRIDWRMFMLAAILALHWKEFLYKAPSPSGLPAPLGPAYRACPATARLPARPAPQPGRRRFRVVPPPLPSRPAHGLAAFPGDGHEPSARPPRYRPAGNPGMA
jgi:hypothetical protein